MATQKITYTDDYNLPLIPTGSVSWVALHNEVVTKLEAGRTVKVVTGAAINAFEVFYINTSDGKAYKATSSYEITGIVTKNFSANATAYGQIDGVVTNNAWNWDKGKHIYVSPSTSGALTQTVPNNNVRPFGMAITDKKILLYGPTLPLPESVQCGSGSGYAKIGGKIYCLTDDSDAATQGNANERSLMAYNIPAYTLNAVNKGIKVTAFGTTAANTHSKDVKLYFNSVNIGALTTSTSGDSWKLEATIIENSSNAQKCICTITCGTSVKCTYTTTTANTNNIIETHVSGQNSGSYANDIVARGFIVEYIG